MNVKLLAHTQLTKEFAKEALNTFYLSDTVSDGQAVALTAIRTCYSPGKPSEIVAKEGAKYFGKQATDGEGGTEADRLFRMIVRSGHSSTLEHVSFTFAIEDVSRALLAQLTRHRVGFSYSVQSQRYVKQSSSSKHGGFNAIIPDTAVKHPQKLVEYKGEEANAEDVFNEILTDIQLAYDRLIELGIPQEDARAVLPQASTCNLVMTANLRAILEFYGKRKPGKGAQKEITDLAEALRKAVVEVEPWTNAFFE
jgi:thymidylate synthase (FAD)